MDNSELETAQHLANEYIARLTSAHSAIDNAKKLLLDSATPFDELRTKVAELTTHDLPPDVLKILHSILNLHAASATPYDAACAFLQGIDTAYTSGAHREAKQAA